MAAAILTQGISHIRDAIAAKFTHVGVATDTTAFSISQTAIDPANAGGANFLVKARSTSNVNALTVDLTMTITGATEFTGKNIYTVGVLVGTARTDAGSRSVRAQPIGVQSGDVFTVGVRIAVSDVS